MHITRAKRLNNSKYLMQNQILDTVDTDRYFGVVISSNLNFKQHINRITSNANRTLGFLKRNIRVKHPGVREAVYQTLLSKKISNDQELIQSDPTSCPQNQKGNN